MSCFSGRIVTNHSKIKRWAVSGGKEGQTKTMSRIWGRMFPHFDNPRYKLNNINDSNNYFSSIFQNKLGETSKEFIIQESYEPNCVVGLCGDFSSGSAGFRSELFSSILISLFIILMTVKWMKFFKAFILLYI